MATGEVMELMSLANEIDELIQSTVPEAVSVSKYGGTLYTLNPDEKEGQFCGVFIYSNHVQIAFSRGAELSDPDSLLIGKGKLRRHVNFESRDEADFRQLRALIKEAARLC